MSIVEFKNVWETFRIKFIVDGKSSWDNLWALKDITFKLEKGETLGVIGENGAGKTTLLKLIAGILSPDRGEVVVGGKVSGLLELGAGFQAELTGRDNIYLSGSMFGLNNKIIDGLYEDIVNFASLGRFINAQVKCYSQGMFVRLAFSIAVHMNPDILLIDDTLAVGDEFFQKKCIKKIFEIKEQGTTLVFVTHDMNMLRRLCKRVIFLKKGRIIKDGLVEEIVPLYTQMVGAKKEVEVLKQFPLTVVFNSGKIFINWHNNLISPSSGLYTSFRILNKWYSSLQADWEVDKPCDNSLIARGKMYQLDLTQVWKIELTGKHEIKLDIEIESVSPLDIQEGYVNMMLTPEYTHWCTALEDGDFPPIIETDKDWISLLGDNTAKRSVGIDREGISEKAIPSLVFQYLKSSFPCYSQILNSDYLSNCRVLQYKVTGLQNFSNNHGEAFAYFSGKIIIGDFSARHYLEKLQDNFTLKDGKLKLIFDYGKCAVLFDGKFMTKSDHIFAMFYINGRWYSSKTASWKISKEEDNIIIARGKWQNLPLTQVWIIERNGGHSFSLKVYLDIEENINIPQQYLRFECSQEYDHYYSHYGKGKFPEIFIDYEKDILQRCIPDGEIIFQNRMNDIVPLSIRFIKGLGSFAKIFNSDISTQARVLKIEIVQAEDNTQFFPDEYLCFDVVISLSQAKTINNDIASYTKMLRKDKLKFIFDNGRGRIYWAGHELTKKLGVYTSLRALGTWHDSYSSAVWDIKESGDVTECVGRWLHLPLAQLWRVKLEEDNIIMLEILISVDEDIELDRLQTNVMLTERYKEWFTGKSKGFFPPFNGNADDDWDVIVSNTNDISDTEFVGVLNNDTNLGFIPALKFLSQRIGQGYKLNIVNSDLYHRGRVLQYLSKKKTILVKGKHPYFKGNIVILGNEH